MDPLLTAILQSGKERIPDWVQQNLGSNKVGGYTDVAEAPEGPGYGGRAVAAYERSQTPGVDTRSFARRAVDAILALGDPRSRQGLLKGEDVGMGFFNPAFGMAGMLAGKKAVGAPLEKLKKALEAEARGVPSQEIWRKYGWERGADKQWRWEISDNAARISQRAQDVLGGEVSVEKGVMGDVLEHPDLYKAYPGLAQIPASVVKAAREGSYMPSIVKGRAKIKVAGETPSDVLSALVHEGQHGVDEIEGFATGGSPAGMGLGDIERIRATPTSVEDLRDPAMTAYRRLAGEVGARNTEARLADSDLRKFAPGLTEDVPRMLQIVRMLQEGRFNNGN